MSNPITRVYDVYDLVDRFSEKHNEISGNKSIKNTIKGPDIQAMNRKIYIKNFRDVCQSMNRDSHEVSKYISEELKIQTSISANGQLIIHGSYRKNQIQDIVVKYITNFVRCPLCKAYDTQLNKENKITFIKCNKCQASNAL